MTRDEALIYLNDRCGQEAELYVELRDPHQPQPRIIVSAIGTLQHWRHDPAQASSEPREDWHGAYAVGDVNFNVTSLQDLTVEVDIDGRPWSYVFALSDDVTLLIVWQSEAPLPPP